MRTKRSTPSWLVLALSISALAILLLTPAACRKCPPVQAPAVVTVTNTRPCLDRDSPRDQPPAWQPFRPVAFGPLGVWLSNVEAGVLADNLNENRRYAVKVYELCSTAAVDAGVP